MNGFSNSFKQLREFDGETKTLIDVILTNNLHVIRDTQVIPLSIGDLDMVGAVRKTNFVKFPSKTIIYRDFRNYDKNYVCEQLHNCDWSDVYFASNVNTAWNNMKGKLLTVLNTNAPLCEKRKRGKPCQWLTSDIKTHMTIRDHLLRKYRKSGSVVDNDTYKQKRNQVKGMIKRAKQNYNKSLLEKNKDNPDKFWNIIKSIFPIKGTKTTEATFLINNEETKNGSVIAAGFSKYYATAVNTLKNVAFKFMNLTWKYPKRCRKRTQSTFRLKTVTSLDVNKKLCSLKRKKSAGLDNIPPSFLNDTARVISDPLTYIINLSITTSTYPEDWKLAKLITCYKSGNTKLVENYRPISVIQAVSKVIEKIVHEQFYEYLETNNLLSSSQFGFRKHRSTEAAATVFFDKVKRGVDKNKMVGAIFIDLCKAFDTIGHGELLYKLQLYGVSGNEFEWFQDYLFGRKQAVSFGSVLSPLEYVTTGVPQGSILGPLLFILFFNDLPECLRYCEVIKYADDTVIFYSHSDFHIIQTRLSSDMERLHEWCDEYQLILNLKKGKTEAMMFGTSKMLSKQPLLNITYKLRNINVTLTYKYLGMEINSTLNLNSYFEKCCKKASSRLRLLKKLKPHLTDTSAKSIYLSMIVPTLTYCSITKINLTGQQLSKLDKIHSNACFLITSMNQTRNVSLLQ